MKLFGTKKNPSRVQTDTGTTDTGGNGTVKRFLKIFSNKKVLRAALISFLCIFLCSLVYLGYVLYTHLNRQIIIDQVTDMWEANKQQQQHAVIVPTVPPAADNFADEPEDEQQESERDRERRLLLEAEARGREIHANLLEINPDFLGMIEIPGLIVKQPYVLSGDNNEYLRLDFNGNRSSLGTIFLSMFNDRLMMDNNSTFFGHYSDTGNVFGKLLEYKHSAAFEKFPVVVLDGLIGESIWVIFAAHVVEPEAWWMTPYTDRDDYANHLEEIKARSLFVTDVDVTVNDRIITLAVCDYSYEDMRFVVHARRLRPGEEAPAGVTAETNRNRKDYTIPHLNQLADLNMTGFAFAVNPANNKFHYFQPYSGSIVRYSGDSNRIQGPFRVLTDSGISQSSFIAAEIVRVQDDEHRRAAYVAVQGVGGAAGISLYTSEFSTSTLRAEGLVTPDGINARFPAIQNISNTLWLLYSVYDEGGSSIYRQYVRGGGTEHLYTVTGVSDARPLGVYSINSQTILVWHEPSSGNINGSRTGSEDVVYLSNTGTGARVTLYGSLSGASIPCVIESNGRLTFGSVSLSSLIS